MVRALEQRLPLRQIFSDDRADFWNRLDPGVSSEGLVDYWKKRVDVLFDSTKNTISVEVQAFTPEDSVKIATVIVDLAKLLVNELSAQARRDAVQFAAAELARAELRVRGARQDIMEFRIAHNDLDPAATAEATLEVAAGLETERTSLATELASLSGYLSEDAPSVQLLKSRIAALEKEISRIQSRISTGPSQPSVAGEGPNSGQARESTAMATAIGQYQELEINQEFAEQAYTTALASLERARAEAERTQSYLAIYAHPYPTDEAAYPNRGFNVFVVFTMFAILWTVGSLGYLTIRDHVA
jgi:capsular polysaccharide transport system permease protein